MKKEYDWGRIDKDPSKPKYAIYAIWINTSLGCTWGGCIVPLASCYSLEASNNIRWSPQILRDIATFMEGL